jgi:hypothetical protein
MVWAAAFTLLAALWGGYAYFNEVQWLPVMLGLGTGVLLAAFGQEMASKSS